MSSALTRQQRRQIVNQPPLGRLGTVADVTAMVRFLLGAGRGFVAGQTTVVDSGITV